MVFARNPLSLYLGVASKIHIWKKFEKRPRNSVGWRPRWWHHFFEWKRVPSVPSVGFGKKDCGGPEKKTPKSTPRFQRLEQKQVVWVGNACMKRHPVEVFLISTQLNFWISRPFLQMTSVWHINLVLGTPHFSILIGFLPQLSLPHNLMACAGESTWPKHHHCWLSFQTCLIFICCFRTICFCWY